MFFLRCLTVDGLLEFEQRHSTIDEALQALDEASKGTSLPAGSAVLQVFGEDDRMLMEQWV